MSKKLNILIFGPAYGHNMQPFIEFFEANDSYEITFAYSGKNDFINTNKKINFVEYSKNPFNLLKLTSTIKKKYDIIWYHGGYTLSLLFLIQKFKSKNTKLILNVWGEQVPRIMLKNDSEAKKYLNYYNKADIIQCNWYGVQNLLKQNFAEEKLPVFPWGLHKEFFMSEVIEVQQTTKEFLDSVNAGITNFFYPKSFTEASDHDCIIEAVKILKGKGVINFCVYFWSGNISRGDFENNAIQKIDEYGLQNLVKIENHNFLPFYDIKMIWQKMDCGLQISIYDQLSSTIIEPMFMEKELIATNIEPYQILANKHPELELHLIERKPSILGNRMEDFIDGNRTSDTVLENRRKVIENEFNFEENIEKMMVYYQQLLKK